MNKYIVVTDQKLLFPQFVKNFGILNLGVDPGPGDLFNSLPTLPRSLPTLPR